MRPLQSGIEPEPFTHSTMRGLLTHRGNRIHVFSLCCHYITAGHRSHDFRSWLKLIKLLWLGAIWVPPKRLFLSFTILKYTI